MSSRDEQGHCGWTNYATWATQLWFENTQGDYDFWNERADECLIDAEGDKEAACSNLADEMKEQVEEAAHDLTSGENEIGNGTLSRGPCWGLMADLLNSAICDVNWREIASHWIDAAIERQQSEAAESSR